MNLGLTDPTTCWIMATALAFTWHAAGSRFGDLLRYRAEEKLRPQTGSIVPRR